MILHTKIQRDNKALNGCLNKVLACAGAVSIAALVETAYFYNIAMKRSKAKIGRTMKMSGANWEQYMPLIAERKMNMMEQPHKDVYHTAFDGLKLHATYFPAVPEYVKEGEKKKVLIGFHGYTSQGLSDFVGVSDYYFKRGFDILLPDARAHGASEGTYVGFGCLDRKDALGWIKWVIKMLGDDIEIILHGNSLGGATVLMASGMKLPPQVKGIISDSGFTSAKEVFTHVLHTMYHLPTFPVIPLADMVNRKLAGYGMDECNAKREVRKAEVPILFIHGANDTFVPCSMCHEIYEECVSPKMKLIVKKSSHAECYYKNPEIYEQTLTEFLTELKLI